MRWNKIPVDHILHQVVSPKDVVRDTVSTFSDPTGKKVLICTTAYRICMC